LVIFVGLFLGGAGGIVYMALRRWLPRRAWQSGLAFGALALVMTRPVQLLDPDSRDFVLLRPVGLAVVLLVIVPLLYGVVLAALVARLDRSYPDFGLRPRAVLAYAPMLVLLLPPFFLAPAVA